MSIASASDNHKSMARFAEELYRGFQRVPSEDKHPDVVLLNLQGKSFPTKLAFHSDNCLVRLGVPSPAKVIMLVGATGAGKSTLIDAFANFILEVKWEDNFRFKLVDEQGTGIKIQSQAESQTRDITPYTIHNSDHIDVPYRLTIIDTPGFGHTSGIEHDRAIVDKIREFFSHPETHGVDHIDAVGFVVPSSQARLTPTQHYIFESILSIFGKDIEPNILLLITFSDGQSPPVLEAVKKAKVPFGKTFKFNNSGLFASRGDGGMSFDAMFWQMGYTSMKEFFDALDTLQPKSLTLTQEVLQERKRLEIVLEGLQHLIQIACDQKEWLNNRREMLEAYKKVTVEYQMKTVANKLFKFEAEVPQLVKVPHPGKGSTNCPDCHFTCHHPCTFSHIKFWCHAMTWLGKCTVCPGKCSSRKHIHEYCSYRLTTMTQKMTLADVHSLCLDGEGQIKSPDTMIEEVDADLANVDAAVVDLIKESHGCTQRLEKIALKPKPTGVMEYLDVLIETENATKKKGWEKRVGALKATKEKEKNEKIITDAAASDRATITMWNKILEQSEFSTT